MGFHSLETKPGRTDTPTLLAENEIYSEEEDLIFGGFINLFN